MALTSMVTPRFIKATSPAMLEKLMLQNNLKRKAWHQYQIVYDGKAWFAWYHVDVSGIYNTEVSELTTDAVQPVNS